MRGEEKQNKKIELGPTEQNKSKQKDKPRQKKTEEADDEDRRRRSPMKPEEARRSWQVQNKKRRKDTGFRTFPRRTLGVPAKRSRGIVQPDEQRRLLLRRRKSETKRNRKEKKLHSKIHSGLASSSGSVELEKTTKDPTTTASGVNQVPTGSTQESMREPDDGCQIVNFGWYPCSSYNEARNWICNGKIDLNELLQRCDMRGKQLQKFMAWFYQKQLGKWRKKTCEWWIHFAWVGGKTSAVGFFLRTWPRNEQNRSGSFFKKNSYLPNSRRTTGQFRH